MSKKMVNGTVRAIEDIYLDSDWQKIIKSRNNVRIPEASPLSRYAAIHDQPDSIWEIIDRDGVQIHENAPFITGLRQGGHSALEWPNDIFVVDHDTFKSSENKCGVLVLPEDEAYAEPVKISWEKDIRHGEPFMWNQFFREDVINKVIPSNALIICDRYLFNDNFDEGIQNLVDILDVLLPQTMNGEYHILIVTDKDSLFNDNDNIHNWKEIYAGIDELHNFLSENRKYDILIELMAIPKLNKGQNENKMLTPVEYAISEFYKKTHDRYIFSNYFMATASHGFCAVRSHGDICTAAWDQTLSFKAIYTGIDNKYQDQSSLPICGSETFITALKKYISTRITPGSKCRLGYLYSKGKGKGYCINDFKKLKNRLVSSCE